MRRNRKRRAFRVRRFVVDVVNQTPFVKMLALLIVLWLAFSAGIYFAERGMADATLTSYGRALYWGIAAFSTAGIADTPLSGLSQVIGGVWIIIGSTLFFGTIVATVTAYFMRPLQRPAKQLIETIEYNLEQLDDLSVEELDLLKKTVDALIANMERTQKAREKRDAEA